MNHPNILFVILTTEIGGVEVVTSVLANKFVSEGYGVSIFSFLTGKNTIADRLDKRIKLYHQNDYSKSKENIARLREILQKNQIQLVVNQCGMPLIPIRTILMAAKGIDVKIISAYHSEPGHNGRIQKLDDALATCNNPMIRCLLYSLRWMVKKVTGYGMAYNYKHSDKFLVLSPSHIEKFKHFTGLKQTARLQVMPNSVNVAGDSFSYSADKKQKEILYVGRLDMISKHVDRVIDTWGCLEEHFPDWRLTIVGDGDAKADLILLAESKGLQRVAFEGYQSPEKYYERASLLLLTSDFEGFGLVVVEGMTYGVVPAIYDSYSAASDIIENGKDGILLPFHKEGFRADEAASLFSEVLVDASKRERMAVAAMAKSKDFSLEKVFDKWITLIRDL